MSDGPRALRPQEWEQLNTLVYTVFRPEMFHNYPQLFNEANRRNLRVVADEGRVVTHVGMTQREAALAGCRVRVVCIGAVATYQESRGKGYASLAFQDCCDKAAADGVDVMLISGGRGLYTRVGCRQVGNDLDFTLEGAGPAALQPERYAIEPATVEDIPALRRLHAAEGTRFMRPLEDWQLAFSCGIVMNTPSDYWTVRLAAGGAAVAYVIVHQPDRVRRRNPDDPRLVRVVEFAGDRGAVAGALPLLVAHYRAQQASIHVQGSDPALRVLLEGAGLSGRASGASGTLRVINFPQLMERCRPLLAERLGTDVAKALVFEADDRPGSAIGGFSVRQGQEVLRIPDLATLAQLVFGAPQPDAEVITSGSSRLRALLARALPLPSLWYGINYV